MNARTDANEQSRTSGSNRRESQQTAEAAGQAAEEGAEGSRRATEEAAEATRKTVEEAAERSRRATEQAAEVTAQTAEAASEIGRASAETVQQSLRSGLEIASQITDRSLRAIAQAIGMPTKEGEETTQQATRNVETILKCGTVLAHGFQDISREWRDRAQGQVQKNLDGMGRLMSCRTPQDAMRIQSDMVRDNLQDLIQTSQRVSELMMTVTNDAMGEISAQQRENPAQRQQAH